MSEVRSGETQPIKEYSGAMGLSSAIPQWIFVFGVLLISWGVVHLFGIEEQLGLVTMFPFFIGGFAIHSVMPREWRLPFFLVLTGMTALYLFGIGNALWLFGLVALMLWMAHWPVSFKLRVWLIVFLGLLLALMISGVLPSLVPSNMITIVASIFMFRMIIYLYDLRHEKEEVPWMKRLGYFFMLPNLIFPIYPIVDYKAYKNSYYNGEDLAIYRRGATMVIRGIFHLLIYRVVYLYLIPSPDEITGLLKLSQYLVMSYVTIIRLSGMFHIVVGMLVLFGFNLPEIFNNYFLANGFSDYWRRINIYWKDFILKIFYYPLYFRFKSWGPVRTVVIITLLVFAVNWLLHVYQWFWVLGRVYVRATDVAFWTIFGVLVTISAVLQQTSNKKKDPRSTRYAVANTIKIMITFTLAALMWSIWISPTFQSWFGVMGALTYGTMDEWLIFISLLFIVLGLGAGGHYIYHNHIKGSRTEEMILKLNLPVMAVLLGVVLFAATHRGQAITSEKMGFSLGSIMEMKLNKADQTTQFEGYYDEILTANNLSSPLWQADPEDKERMHKTEMVRRTNDILINDLKPSYQMTFKGKDVRTNQWGLRDKEYSKLPDSNVIRTAVIGGSIELGSGVSNDEIFENLIEEKLNEEWPDSMTEFEILNFSMSSRNIIQHLYNLEMNVVGFEPDVMILFNHDREWNAITNLFLKVMKGQKGVDSFPYEYLNDILEEIDARVGTSKEEVLREVIPYLEDIYRWCYKEFGRVCRENNIQPVWVHIPSLQKEGSVRIPYGTARRLAQDAGFICIGLNDVFSDRDPSELMVGENDSHPNDEGHRLIAEDLYRKMMQRGIFEDSVINK